MPIEILWGLAPRWEERDLRQSKMTVGKKFASVGAFLIAMTILLGIATLLGLGSVQRALSSVTEDSLAGVSASSKVESGLLEIRGDIWRHIASTDASQMAQMEREIQRLKDEVNTSLTSLEKSAFTDEERVLAGKIRPAADRYYKAWDGIIDLSRASKNEEANKKYTAEAAPAFDEMKQAVKAETEYHRTHGVQNGAEAQGTGTGVQVSDLGDSGTVDRRRSGPVVSDGAGHQPGVDGGGVRFRQRGRTGGQRGYPDRRVQPVACPGVRRAGSFLGRDLVIERGNQLHGAEEHRQHSFGREADAISTRIFCDTIKNLSMAPWRPCRS